MITAPGPTEGLPGRRVAPGWARADRRLVEAAALFPTTVIGDAMHRLGPLSGTIGPMWPGARLTGTACTVWVRSGDNARIHQAISAAEPGDVLVVNGHGSVAHALFGELMALDARRHGVVGLVVDGAVRDVDAMAALGFPVFAAGVCPAGPTKEGTGEIGYPVAVGGVVVAPGDLVVADADGVVVVPKADAAEVLAAAGTKQEWEQEQRAALRGGGPGAPRPSGSARPVT